MHRLRIPNQRGVSIMEVLVSSVVFLIGFSGIAMLHTFAAGFDAHASKVDRATMIADELLGYLETVPATNSVTGAPTVILKDANPGNDGNLRDAKGFFTEAQSSFAAAAPFDFDADNNAGGGAWLPDAYDSSAVNPCAFENRDCKFRGYRSVRVAVPAGLGTGGRPSLDFNGDGKDDFQRYWIIANDGLDPSSGKPVGKFISVIVRWHDLRTNTWRRVVVTGYRNNEALMYGQS